MAWYGPEQDLKKLQFFVRVRGGGVLDDGPEHDLERLAPPDSENDKGLAFNYFTDPGPGMRRRQQHTMREFDYADEDKKMPSGLSLKHSCGSKVHNRYHLKKHLGG